MFRFTIARLGVLLLALIAPVVAQATLTVTPITFNVVGLDSNTPASGPKFFPVGVRVCSNVATTNVTTTWLWDSANANINLRTGSLGSIFFPAIAAGAAGCRDAYFEVEITQVPAAFDTTRRYHVTAADGSGTFSSPVPREIYVEHLISQSRNAVTGVKLNGVPIPPGGSVALVLGNTYTIELDSGTATQGYNQFESFINFSNAIFQIQSVTSAYSADNSPYVPGPAPITSDKLYADACLWENNPASPNYRSCVGGDFKAGGSTITTTYVVTIIGGGGSAQTLSTLLYDFSGSSYHYNADFSVTSFIANIIDPTNLNFAKAFSPSPAVAGGTSTLTFTIGNPNAATIGGANFTDTLPLLGASQMVVATPAVFSTSGCGAATFAPVAGASSISFSNGTVAANSTCTASVRVALPALPTVGTYANVSGNLFVGAQNTGKNATANLGLTSVAPPASSCGLTLAQWTMPVAAGAGVPPLFSFKAADVATATAASGAGLDASTISATIGNPVNSWATHGYSNAAALDTTNNDYLEFAVTTTNYNSLTFSFDARRDGTLNGPNSLALYSSTDGVTFTPYGAVITPVSGVAFATNNQAFPGPSNASGLTYFRIYGYNAANLAGTALLFVDNITIGGCQSTPPPTITKTFLTNPVAVGGTSTLQFTLTNPATTGVTGVKFTDSLPAGTQVAAAPAASTTCTGSPTWAPAAGATTLNFGQVTGATMAGGASCTVSVNVTATTAGPHTNVSGFVSSIEGGTNTTATGSAVATLTALQPPTITKTFGTSPILTGATSLLTVTIQNPNPGDALGGVAVADAYPAGLVNANPLVPPVGNSCGGVVTAAAGGNGLSLSGGAIAAGGSCAITVPVTSAIVGTYVNVTGPVSASIAGSGNTASATLVVDAPNPSISLAKRVSTSATGPWVLFLAVAPGTPLYYQFTAENTGDQPFNPFGVTDPTLAGTGADPASCVWQSPNVPPTLPVLPVASATVDPTATCVTGPIAAALGNVTNTATAHGTFAGQPYNSSPAQASYLGAIPGFSLVKQVGTSATGPWSSAVGVAAGADVFYRLVIVNTGGLALNLIGVTDPTVSTASCVYIDPLPVPGATTCIVGPIVATGISGSTTPNTAIAHGTNGVTIFSAPSTASYTIASANADLAITKTDGVSNVNAGGSTTYTITVTNNGPDEVTAATVVDTAPPGMTFGAWTCAVTNAGSGGVVVTACGAASGSGNINTTVTMKVGAIITYTVPATVSGGASGTLVNSATVTTPPGTFDPTPANDTATDSDTVDAIADLAITKTNGVGTVTAGAPTTYTVTVTNNGPSIVTGAILSDLPAAGLSKTAVVCSGTPGQCVAPPTVGQLESGTFALPLLTNGATYQILVTATVTAPGGGVTNTATIAPPVGTPDPNPGNDTASDTDGVQPSADVSMVKTLVTPGPFTVGQSIQYTLDVANAGPSPATNIQITDTPTNLTITNVSGGGCAALPCTVGFILPGGSVSITVTATINAAGVFDNTATAMAFEPDPNLVNNTDSTGNNGVAAASADVSLVKTLVTAGPFVVGQSIQYTLFVANAGPSTATSVQITDTPTNLTIINVSGACVALPCTVASIASGGSVNIAVTATINAAGVFDNTATAMAVEPDPNLANNTDNTGNSGVAAASADVSLVKTLVAAGPFVIGQSIQYTLFVANAGPSTATSIQITDTPTNLTITNVSGACVALPCIVASIASGGSVNITVAATINAAGVFDNTATALAVEPDPNLANNTDSTGNGGVAAASADVSLVKTLGTAGPYSVGQSLTYTLVVANAGPSTATSVQVTDTPSNLTITNVSGACVALPCTVASIASGGSVNITVTATINAAGAFDNSATATALEPDPNPSNNTDNTGNGGVASPVADLAITKTDGVASVNAGASTVYTITVTNNGPSSITGAILADPIAAGLSKTAVACSATPGACVTAPTVVELESGTFALPLLANGATYQITVTATVTAASGTVTNTATIAPPAGASDPTPGNNSATDIDSVIVAPVVADLAITKTDGVASVNAGASTVYTITVTNNGPSGVTGAILADPIAAGLSKTAVACSATPGACVTAPTVVELESGTFALPLLANGATYQITVTATVTAASGTVTNTATIAPPAGASDPTPGNNSATDIDSVIAGPVVADLAINKTNGASSLTPGGGTTYTITVTNNGPAEVTGATVTDLAPAGLTFGNWTCAVTNAGSGGVVVTACGSPNGSGNINALVTLKVGAVVTFTVPATVAPNAAGTIVNVATVNVPPGVTDPTPNNSSSSDSDVVSGAPAPAAVGIPTLDPLALGLLMLLLGAMSARIIKARRTARDV